MDGTVRVKRRGRVRKAKKTSIYDVYEPSELERGYFTEKDAEIRVTDMPERFQVKKILWLGLALLMPSCSQFTLLTVVSVQLLEIT